MGIFRVYLALCVISAHANAVFPWQMHDGKQAVQTFYMISGFYMAMVFPSRYASAWDFYKSRIMRIFPPYWIVLLGTVMLSVVGGLLFHQWFLLSPYVNHPLEHNGLTGVLLAAVFNVTLIGQDWIMFLKNDIGHTLYFTKNFWENDSPLWHYLLVPQCWSIGVELTFYACVPIINRLRTRWLVFIAITSLVARLIAYYCLGLAHDPWDYRFFPFEISLFIFGMLAYRLYARTKSQHFQRFRCVSWFSYVIAAIIVLLLLYVHIRIVDFACHIAGGELGVLITYPIWIFGIPVLFIIFGNQKIDRIIGELSYPIYLVHYFVVSVIAIVFGHFGLGQMTGSCSALVSIILAIMIYRAFIVPIDIKRHFLTERNPANQSFPSKA